MRLRLVRFHEGVNFRKSEVKNAQEIFRSDPLHNLLRPNDAMLMISCGGTRAALIWGASYVGLVEGTICSVRFWCPSGFSWIDLPERLAEHGIELKPSREFTKRFTEELTERIVRGVVHTLAH